MCAVRVKGERQGWGWWVGGCEKGWVGGWWREGGREEWRERHVLRGVKRVLSLQKLTSFSKTKHNICTPTILNLRSNYIYIYIYIHFIDTKICQSPSPQL